MYYHENLLQTPKGGYTFCGDHRCPVYTRENKTFPGQFIVEMCLKENSGIFQSRVFE